MTVLAHLPHHSSSKGCRFPACVRGARRESKGVPPVPRPIVAPIQRKSSWYFKSIRAGGDDSRVSGLRDLFVVVVGLERTKTFFTAGEEFNGIFPSALPALNP